MYILHTRCVYKEWVEDAFPHFLTGEEEVKRQLGIPANMNISVGIKVSSLCQSP